MAYNFTDKVVLITGASSGIGKSTSLTFAQNGAKLALTGRNVANLNVTGKECKNVRTECEVFIHAADLSKIEEIEGLVQATVKHFGRIDVLVNNAGIIATGNIIDMPLNQYEEVHDTNVKAVLLLTKAAVPHLINTKGNIVNVSSVMGIRSAPNSLAYCMSKAALDQFTRCCSLDLAKAGVRVNSVNPGVTVTELHRRGGMDEKEYAEFLERCKATHALGRAGEAQEVADAIVYLASDKASFVTGTLLSVDGGRHVMCPR